MRPLDPIGHCAQFEYMLPSHLWNRNYQHVMFKCFAVGAKCPLLCLYWWKLNPNSEVPTRDGVHAQLPRQQLAFPIIPTAREGSDNAAWSRIFWLAAKMYVLYLQPQYCCHKTKHWPVSSEVRPSSAPDATLSNQLR